MPLFKSKSKLTVEEQLTNIRAKADENLAKSRAKFDKEHAKMDEESKDPFYTEISALCAETIASIRSHTDSELIKYRAGVDERLANFALEKAQLTLGTKEYKELVKKERHQLKVDRDNAAVLQHNEEVPQRDLQIAKSNERIAQIDAHNKAVLQDIASDFRGIKSNFIEENRQITQQNRQRVQQMRGNRNPNLTLQMEISEELVDFSSLDASTQTNHANSRVEALKSLKELLDSGVLTQAEFDAEKSRILNNN